MCSMERKPFSNRYVFAKVMGDRPDLCKAVVERILGFEVGRIERIEIESEETSITRRGVRFDVFMAGDDATFEVEMQTYDQQDLPLRMRYYRSQIDRRSLLKGGRFAGLKPVYVIFICLDDRFGHGLPVYTFESRCLEDDTVQFDNGVHDVVLNASGDLSRTNKGIADLLTYVKENRVAEDDELTYELAEAVDDAYLDEEWVEKMSMLDWDIEDAYARGCRETRAEALEEGRAEGEVGTVFKFVKDGLVSLSDAATSLGMSEDELLGKAKELGLA